jgi:hypothetical protein
LQRLLKRRHRARRRNRRKSVYLLLSARCHDGNIAKGIEREKIAIAGNDQLRLAVKLAENAVKQARGIGHSRGIGWSR